MLAISATKKPSPLPSARASLAPLALAAIYLKFLALKADYQLQTKVDTSGPLFSSHQQTIIDFDCGHVTSRYLLRAQPFF